VFHFAHTVTTMSTGTELAPGRRAAATPPRARIVNGPLALVSGTSFAVLTSFYLLLAVTPLAATAAGAGTAGAGLVTGVLLLGTVAAEAAAPALMRRYRYRTLLAAGAVLMGGPTIALLFRGPLAVIAAVCFIRGAGFGLGTVADALTAELLPPERRGEGLGLYGMVDSLPAVVALPLGLWLAGHYGFAVVVLLTAGSALAPLAVLRWLPGTADPPRSIEDPAAGQPTGLLAGLRHSGQLRLALIFSATTVAGGVVVSFLPLAAGAAGDVAAIGLLAQALTATVSRWWAGRYGDRHGHAGLLVPGLTMAALGMVAMIWLAAPAVIAGMCLFGIGFGIIQNTTLVLMINGGPAAGIGTASALWNLAYDAGYGAGPVVFGLFVGHTGYSAAFAATGVLMLAALPAGRRSSRPASEPRLRREDEQTPPAARLSPRCPG
jgi:predicted MFS family arabinose efflux permease